MLFAKGGGGGVKKAGAIGRAGVRFFVGSKGEDSYCRDGSGGNWG